MNAKKYILPILYTFTLFIYSCGVNEPGVLNPILINDFTISANGTLAPGSKVQILAEAHSTLGSPLTYNFSIISGNGTLTSSTNEILPNLCFFTAPTQGGPSHIQLTVTDTQGNKKQATYIVWTKKSWKNILTRANTDARSEDRFQSICATPDNKAYFTCQDWSGWTLKASCSVYDGNSWSTARHGTYTYFSPNRAYYIHSVAGPQYPYVTFLDQNSGYRAVVYRYTGTNWLECIPGTSFDKSYDNRPKLALSPDNTLYLATRRVWYSGGKRLAVMQLTSSNWLQVGTNMFAGSIGDISLTTDRNNNPVVAYIGDGYLSIKQRSGEQWIDLGPRRFIAENIQGIMLTTCKKRIVHIAYQRSTDSKIYVQKFDEGQWKMVGSGAATAGAGSYANLLFDSSNTPHIVFKDGQHGGKVSARRFDGTIWQYTGQPGASDYEVEFLSAAIAPNNTIYAAFRPSYKYGASQVLQLR